MRGFIFGLSISIAFVAGCVAASMQLVVPPARAGTRPVAWEYLCPRNASPAWRDEAAGFMNQMGQEGWEAFAAVGKNGPDLMCFKRPL